MLTGTALRQLKSKDKSYKVSDRDGIYVTVSEAVFVHVRIDAGGPGGKIVLLPWTELYWGC